MARIAQVANFVAPRSGGIRTVLRHLAEGYARAGHEVIQIVPGPREQRLDTDWGVQVQLRGAPIPHTGYRLITPGAVVRQLLQFRPDRLEVHDRTTLRGVAAWSCANDVPSTLVSHERVDRLLAHWFRHLPLRWLADSSNAALALVFDSVVCTTEWAAEEFRRLGVSNLNVVPLGVDAATFSPCAADLADNAGHPHDVLLAMVTRLSPEKAPSLALATAEELRRRGLPVTMVVAGDGPLRERLSRTFPKAHFLGHLSDPVDLARVLASADVVLAPGPVETFGLGALEALSCGTPVVVNNRSALRGVIGFDGGIAADGTSRAFADAVQQLLSRPEKERRTRARAAAARYSWQRTVNGFLAVHQLAENRAAAARPA